MDPIYERHLARRLAGYIESHLDKPLHLSELSNHLNISAYWVKRVSHSVFKQPPHHYILERRLQKAAVLLERTDTPIKTLCADCGLGDASQFTKAFRKRFGMTPRAYRIIHKALLRDKMNLI